MTALFERLQLKRFVCTVLLLAVGLVFLSSCQKQEKPLEVGFLGCLTGRSSDLGVAGRDGFLLAVDEENTVGGVFGRKVVPVVRDNASDAEKAKQAAKELVVEQVEFVVGPMTSQMALNVVPILDAARIPLISPTVSTSKLIGIDDGFFRVYYANSQAASAMAEHVRARGLNKIAVMYDTENRAYTEEWLRIFKLNFVGDQREVVAVPFRTATAVSFFDLVSSVSDKKPDGLLILANSIDTALICQQALKLNMIIPKFATGWSSSGKLITYGGKSVEGLVVVQSVDFRKDREEVKHFLEGYRSIFFDDPTFPAAHAYDAARLGLQALKKSRGQKDIKQALLTISDLPGILQDFSLDKYGDVVNPPIYFMGIDESVFHSL